MIEKKERDCGAGRSVKPKKLILVKERLSKCSKSIQMSDSKIVK